MSENKKWIDLCDPNCKQKPMFPNCVLCDIALEYRTAYIGETVEEEAGKMDDYISKQAAIEVLCLDCSGANICGGTCDDTDRIREIPPANVRPVVRGRWILDSDPGEPWKYRCNLCGEVTTSTCMGEPRYHYCPMCGADMREEEQDGSD